MFFLFHHILRFVHTHLSKVWGRFFSLVVLHISNPVLSSGPGQAGELLHHVGTKADLTRKHCQKFSTFRMFVLMFFFFSKSLTFVVFVLGFLCSFTALVAEAFCFHVYLFTIRSDSGVLSDDKAVDTQHAQQEAPPPPGLIHFGWFWLVFVLRLYKMGKYIYASKGRRVGSGEHFIQIRTFVWWKH